MDYNPINFSDPLLSQRMSILPFVTETAEEKDMNYKVLRKHVQRYMLNNFRDSFIFCSALGRMIKINRMGIEHTARTKGFEHYNNERIYRDFLLSCKALPELIFIAQYVRSEKDKKEREDVKAIHILQSIMQVDSRRYKLKIVVREIKTEKETITSFFYDHAFLEQI